MHPLYLEMCLEKSLTKLGVATIDCLILANPFEMHMGSIDMDTYFDRLESAFKFYE